MAVVGFGYAIVMVSTFGRAQSGALEQGFNDDIDTYLFIAGSIFWVFKPNLFMSRDSLSGTWTSSFYLGNFLGPTIAGLFVEKYGFRATTSGFVVLSRLMFFVNLAVLYYMIKVKPKKDREKEYEEI